MTSLPSRLMSYTLMIPLIGQYFFKVLEYNTSTGISMGLFSYEVFYVLLPNLRSKDFLRFFIDFVDTISRGVIIKRKE